MKYSLYNVIVDNKPYGYILYNVLSEALLELDENDLEFFNNCLIGNNDEDPRFKTFVDKAFIIADNYDEKAFIRYANQKSSYSNNNLQIVITPTMDCNFKCIYCFESHHKGIMTSETQNQVVSFIKNELLDKNYKRMHIDWFGGEPLLAFSTIESISQDMIDFCNNNNIEYAASIISNGYLLTEEIISKMISLKIEHIQLTLDGEKSIHDSRRMLRNNAGTYDITLDKIALLSNFDIGVSVRVNTDKRNMYSYQKLTDIVKRINPNAHVYPARMECFPETDKNNCSAELSCKEFAYKIQLPHLMADTFEPEMPTKFYSCQAERANSFAIDERGNLYKCWNQIGDVSSSYGNVSNYPDNANIPNLLSYMGNNVFDDEECSNCIALPLCMGGCAYQRMYKNEKQCIAEKYCLDELIKLIWKSEQ